MRALIPRKRMLISYVALYLTFAAATARAWFQVESTSDLQLMIGLLAIYLVALIIEPFLISRSILTLHIINLLQTGIALFLLLFIEKLDYFSLLFIPPCIQSILYFPRKTAMIWIGAIVLLMITGLYVTFPQGESIGYVIIYPTAIFLFTTLSYLAKQAEEAQDRSESLLADLQAANQKLQAYAAQVQELAVVNERNRLARELHDSVTQIIFGLTLSAQAARILIDRDLTRAASELDRLQILSQKALSEMRALVQELRPNSGNNPDLVSLLNQLAAERRANEGLNVELSTKGVRRLDAKIESELFRITQEALNNVAKHAQTDKAVVTLDLENPGYISLEIEDAGVGFDPSKARAMTGHFGLTSIQERVQALGGTLTIDSNPGKGTHLRVDITLAQEVQHE